MRRQIGLLLVAFPLLARAADARLEAIRAVIAPMRTSHVKGLDARGATPAFTTVKHQLRDWIESNIGQMHFDGRWCPDPTVLQERLNDEIQRAGLFCGQSEAIPCPDQTRLGFLGRVILDLKSGVLIVRTRIGIEQCGDDESAYAYERVGETWQRIWQSEQNDYRDGEYFPQWLHRVVVSPSDYSPQTDRTQHLILTIGSEPWCTSNWHDIYYRVWQTKTSHAEPLLLLDGKEWGFVDGDIRGEADSTSVLIEYSVSSFDGLVRPQIRHYSLRDGKLERAYPAARSKRSPPAVE